MNTSAENLKVEIQVSGFELTENMRIRVSKIISKMKRLIPSLEGIVVYLRNRKGQATAHRDVTIRFAVPGPDVVASETGERWTDLFKNVEQKLIRQTIKRKRLYSKRSYRPM